MLATEILTQDHREALDLIGRLENAGDPGSADHSELFEKLRAALDLHLREEEEIYYPALAKHEEFSDLLDYSMPEHEGVREALAQLGELNPSSDAFQETLVEMRAAIEAHAANEEDDVFPESIEVLGRDRIEELGDEIDALRGDSGMSRSARV